MGLPVGIGVAEADQPNAVESVERAGDRGESVLIRASELAGQLPAIVFEAVPSTSRSLASGVRFTPMLPVAEETVSRSPPPA